MALGYANGNFARIEFFHTGLLMIKVLMDASIVGQVVQTFRRRQRSEMSRTTQPTTLRRMH